MTHIVPVVQGGTVKFREKELEVVGTGQLEVTVAVLQTDLNMKRFCCFGDFFQAEAEGVKIPGFLFFAKSQLRRNEFLSLF